MTKDHPKKQWKQRLSDLPDKLAEYQTPAEEKPSKPKRLPREEKARQALVERLISEAIEAGKFDNLPGAGKPLDLNENPYLEPGKEWAFGLLKRNGLAPEWIERDKAIRRETALIRERLRAAWQQRRDNPAEEVAWSAAVAQFEESLHRLNRKIDDFNLIVPVLSAQRARLRLADELQRVKQQPNI